MGIEVAEFLPLPLRCHSWGQLSWEFPVISSATPVYSNYWSGDPSGRSTRSEDLAGVGVAASLI
jgi:hypothetical protein